MSTLDVLTEGLTGDGGDIEVQQALLGQLSLHGGDAASGVEVGHMGGACGSQMAEVRGLLADGVCHLRIQLYACLMRNGRQMQHTVGGTSQCHIDGQSV